MKERECIVCKAKFFAQTSGKYCSPECYKKYQRQKYKLDTLEKQCLICGKTFSGLRQQLNCEVCRRKRNVKWNIIEQKILCKNCNNVIKTKNVKHNGLEKIEIHASSLCGACNAEYRALQRKIMESDVNPAIQKYGRAIKPKLGKYRNFTDSEISERCSMRMKQQNPMQDSIIAAKVAKKLKEKYKSGELTVPKGERHWLWKGNRIKAQTIRSRLYKIWIYPILERDKFQCTRCQATKCRLEVHHCNQTFREVLQEALTLCNVDRLYSTTATQLELVCQTVLDLHRNINGITLCVDCHKEIDDLRY